MNSWRKFARNVAAQTDATWSAALYLLSEQPEEAKPVLDEATKAKNFIRVKPSFWG